MSLARYHAAALEFVNETRAGFALEPLTQLPKGRTGQSCNCPVANALLPCSPVEEVRTFAHGSIVHLKAGSEPFSHPDDVRAFIRAFDDEKYPDLIA